MVTAVDPITQVAQQFQSQITFSTQPHKNTSQHTELMPPPRCHNLRQIRRTNNLHGLHQRKVPPKITTNWHHNVSYLDTADPILSIAGHDISQQLEGYKSFRVYYQNEWGLKLTAGNEFLIQAVRFLWFIEASVTYLTKTNTAWSNCHTFGWTHHLLRHGF